MIPDSDNQFALALGTAVIRQWAELPQGVQHDLFEQAVLAAHQQARDQSMREQLALFLHDHHPRTYNSHATRR